MSAMWRWRTASPDPLATPRPPLPLAGELGSRSNSDEGTPRRTLTRWAGVGGFATLLLLATCSSPPTRFYTLTSAPPAQRAASGPALAPPIEVGDVPVPATMDRNSIVLDADGARLDIASNDQWGAPVGQLIRQALTADLNARLPIGSVLPPGSNAPKSGLRVVSLNIQRFAGDTVGNVTLDASWSVLRAGSSDVLRSGHAVIHVRAASGKVPDIVPAMSTALGQLADRIAAALGTHGPPGPRAS